MKNIHVLPTDKPSRLVKFFTKRFHLCKEILPIQDEEQYQNIYITSDEEIKDVRPHKNKWQLEQGQILNKFPTYLTDLSECKLVIMTTDQDLIADGVQAIDDELLEWFVKNSSCDWVEVVKQEFYSKNDFINGRDAITYNYKIIIPSKEPKYPIGGYAPGYYSCTCVTCKSTFQGDKRAVQCEPCAIKITKEEPKQETIEKAAEHYQLNDNKIHHNIQYRAFKAGAKWQQARMYSEEEVDNLISNILYEVRYDYSDIDVIENNIIELFEQFKKK